jgi:hypothetical protein
MYQMGLVAVSNNKLFYVLNIYFKCLEPTMVATIISVIRLI